ncbi:hypothetical protein COOONC_20247 [Cooperia oncophora]
MEALDSASHHSPSNFPKKLVHHPHHVISPLAHLNSPQLVFGIKFVQWTPPASDLPIKNYQLSWAVSSASEANAFEEMMRRRATLTTHEKRSLDEEEEAWGIEGRDPPLRVIIPVTPRNRSYLGCSQTLSILLRSMLPWTPVKVSYTVRKESSLFGR